MQVPACFLLVHNDGQTQVYRLVSGQTDVGCLVAEDDDCATHPKLIRVKHPVLYLHQYHHVHWGTITMMYQLRT